MDILVINNALEWKAHNKQCAMDTPYQTRKFEPLQWYKSFQPRSVHWGTVTSGFHRCHQLSSSVGTFCLSAAGHAHLLEIQAGFPRHDVTQLLRAFVQRKFHKRVARSILEMVESYKTFTPPSIDVTLQYVLSSSYSSLAVGGQFDKSEW